VAAVMLMDNGASAQNNYYYRNSYRPAQHQGNWIGGRSTQYKPSNKPWAANTINSYVPRSNNNNNNNNWGWQQAAAAAAVKPQQRRWKLDFDDSVEDHSVESSFYRRPSITPRYQRHSVIGSPRNTVASNNNNVAWSRPSPVTARPVQQIRWSNRFDDSVEDNSVESREHHQFRRW
jgi:hypothetical protein